MAHNEPQPSATVSLITGEGPLANAGDAQTVDEDTPMEFNASKTIPITNGTQFHWIFEDNGPKQLEGISPTYTFDIPGIHEVLLTVTDEQGFTSNTTVLITVNDVTPPVAVIIMQDVASGVSIKVGQTVTFDASGSYDPENGTVKPNGYTWNMGDESTLDQTEISHYAIHHQYEKTGVFNVSLTVTDERGNLTGSTTLQVTVGEEALAQTLNLPPTVIGILVILTVAVIVGSAFWLTGATLRKQSFEMRSKDEIEDRQNQ
jgi:PKD repeat protein